MLLDDQKMATNIQFEKWTADQVAEWLRGLDMDDALIPYMHYFLNGGVDGKKLLMMTHADLEKLNVLMLGHQELILEAIDLLRSLRYGYETENMQSLALQLGCKARSLNGEMRARSGENDRTRANTSHIGESQTKRLSIGILSAVADLVVTLKSLLSWMDKAPFSGLHDLCLIRNTIAKLGLDLIFMHQRETSLRDVDNNITVATNTLSEICEKLVIGSQDSPLDPLYLQPTSLEQATIRKKQGEELGMHIQSIYYGVHVISEVKDMSPADLCGKIEKGDEVIQVNNQIVAGWSLKKLVNLLKENPKEVVLLLKKRPRHISPFGQMMNKKKQALMNIHAVQSSTLPKSLKKVRSRDGETKQLRPSMQEFVNTVASREKVEDIDSPKETLDGNDTDNDVFRSGSESPQFTQYSLSIQVDPKQRRATVSGGSPTLSHPLLVVEDIDTPARPKSFTIASTRSIMPHKIIINSPSGDNLSEFLKKTSELKTVSSPPSQDFGVQNSTPKIIESNDELTTMSDNLVKQSEIQLDIDNAVTVTSENVLTTNTVDNNTDIVNQSERTSLDTSTNSVLSVESSLESLQTSVTQDISSHTPNMEERSIHTDRESSDFVLAQPAVHASYNVKACVHQCTPPTRVVQHYEVASDFDISQPQLMKITKIDSLMHTRMADGDKKNKHVGFQDVDSDREANTDKQSSNKMHKVVDSEPQKIPIGSHVKTLSPVQRRNKTVGRKVGLAAMKDRRVSCKDLGKGDCEGWLFKRKAKLAIMSSNWQKRWCVIKDCNLFCYHDMEALKAELVIMLPAFQVSPVDESEVRTKKYPIKIHNNGASFMFASERQEDMAKWMNKMGLAAITYRESVHTKHDPNRSRGTPDPDFSESETEEDIHEKPGKFQPDVHPLNESGVQSRDTSPDLSSSQVDLPQLYRKQSKRGKNIFGEDLHDKRKSTLRSIKEPMSPEKTHLRKLTTLQRTLKAKQKELDEIDNVLSSSSRDKLKELKQYLKSVDAD